MRRSMTPRIRGMCMATAPGATTGLSISKPHREAPGNRFPAPANGRARGPAGPSAPVAGEDEGRPLVRRHTVVHFLGLFVPPHAASWGMLLMLPRQPPAVKELFPTLEAFRLCSSAGAGRATNPGP